MPARVLLALPLLPAQLVSEQLADLEKSADSALGYQAPGRPGAASAPPPPPPDGAKEQSAPAVLPADPPPPPDEPPPPPPPEPDASAISVAAEAAPAAGA